MQRGKLHPFHNSVLSHIIHADASDLKILTDLISHILIPNDSDTEILNAWTRRCQEIKCKHLQMTRHEKREPFHKYILTALKNANVTEIEMKVYANLIHDTFIPDSSYAEILRVWKRRCQEIGCPDHGVTRRLTS